MKLEFSNGTRAARPRSSAAAAARCSCGQNAISRTDITGDHDVNTRRQFLIQAPLGLIGAVAACRGEEQKTPASASTLPPGAPPAFGTAPGAGPAVTSSSFAEAEKLAQITMSPAERQQAAGNWRSMMAPLVERRIGPRKVTLGEL